MNNFKRKIPTILTITSIFGIGATAYSTAKATIKAKERVDDIDSEEPKKVIKKTWKFYIPPFLIGMGTSACVLTSHILDKKYEASIIAASQIVSNSFNEYRRKNIEVNGEEAHQNVVNAIIAQKADKDNVVFTQSFLENYTLDFGLEDEPTYIFYLTSSDTFFESTLSKVLEAEYHLNRNFGLGGDIGLNNLHEFLGIETRDELKELGWWINDDMLWIDFNHYKAENLDIPEWVSSDKTILVIEPVIEPHTYDDENFGIF